METGEMQTGNEHHAQEEPNELDSVRARLRELGKEYDLVGGGKVYTSLRDGQQVEYEAFGSHTIEIDEENLGIEKVGAETMARGWEREKEWFTEWCEEVGTDIEPFDLYKAYLIQRKVLSVLGLANNEAAGHKGRRKIGNDFRLSEAKGMAMCSEQALMAAYLAEKIEEPYKLVVGMSPEGAPNSTPWRESHMYVWFDNLNAVLDITTVKDPDEFPALMVPVDEGASFSTMEQGYDIECQRIGTKRRYIYGLDAGGFDVRLQEKDSPNEVMDNADKIRLYKDPHYVTLYRFENPGIPFDPERAETISKEDLVGSWYTDNHKDLLIYAKDRVRGTRGGRFVTVRVRRDELDSYNAQKLPETREMDIEKGNYIVPSEVGDASRVEIEAPFQDSWEGKTNVPFKDWALIEGYIQKHLTDDAIIEALEGANIEKDLLSDPNC